MGELAHADCIIADVSDRNPNVFFELGLAQAMGKGIILIAEERNFKEVPFDIREFRVIVYSADSKNLSDLKLKISRSLQEFRRFPKQRRVALNFQASPPFFLDWDKLSSREAENLFQELLAQLGFRRLEWGKVTPEIDLVAELPKKDPDGFEYRELWLVSMGLNAPIEMFMDMASNDLEFFLHRFTEYSSHSDFNSSKSYDAPTTILLVLFRKSRAPEELQHLKERLEKRRFRRGPFGSSVRLRIWDRDYLSSLVQRFPHIGYKYFSDEGRMRSTSRKSYEDLYLENSQLSERQAKLILDLEEEKNKRTRAERDAIWKDISFSAAHKIGNPIFAIETDLEPLLKRIRENRQGESIEVVENIRSSVDKAKAFVEQFKSLAKAQEIKPVPMRLKPILEDSCTAVSNHNVVCRIECPDELTINGDPDRLAECFDELIMNASHWFNKTPKTIDILVTAPAPKPLPDFLDTSKSYLIVNVKDNGAGIPSTEKSRIFDAFYTKYEHGTGLGLALVRRIIDGHSGGIIETGMFGQGANFDIYLPLMIKAKSKKRTLMLSERSGKSKEQQNG